MNGGGGSNFPPPQPNGGDFILSLLQKPRPNPHPSQSSTTQQSPIIDPAVAMMGPTIPTNGHDHPNHHPHHHHHHHQHQQHPHLPPWSHTPSPHVFGLTHNPFPLQRVPETHYSNFTNANGASLTEDLRRLGFQIQSNNNNNNNGFIQQQQHQHQQQELKLQFGSLPTVSYAAATTSHDVSTNGFVDRNKIEKRGVIGEQIRVPPPPGFGNKEELGGGRNVRLGFGDRGNVGHELRLPDQLDNPGPPSGSNLRSGYDDVDAVGERLADSLLLEDEKSGISMKRHGPKEKVNA